MTLIEAWRSSDDEKTPIGFRWIDTEDWEWLWAYNSEQRSSTFSLFYLAANMEHLTSKEVYDWYSYGYSERLVAWTIDENDECTFYIYKPYKDELTVQLFKKMVLFK